jgi:hypothetical protein
MERLPPVAVEPVLAQPLEDMLPSNIAAAIAIPKRLRLIDFVFMTYPRHIISNPAGSFLVALLSFEKTFSKASNLIGGSNRSGVT